MAPRTLLGLSSFFNDECLFVTLSRKGIKASINVSGSLRGKMSTMSMGTSLLTNSCLQSRSESSCLRACFSSKSNLGLSIASSKCNSSLHYRNTRHRQPRISCNAAADRPASQPRFIQHKQEAFWFYKFLSIVYDHIINPGHWTEDMREDALEPADLNDPNLVVVDVGGGTGFTTLGVVKTVDAKNVTILDQSPDQLQKAREKSELKDCTIIEGDAEDLPFATDYADRYVSAGR